MYHYAMPTNTTALGVVHVYSQFSLKFNQNNNGVNANILVQRRHVTNIVPLQCATAQGHPPIWGIYQPKDKKNNL